MLGKGRKKRRSLRPSYQTTYFEDLVFYKITNIRTNTQVNEILESVQKVGHRERGVGPFIFYDWDRELSFLSNFCRHSSSWLGTEGGMSRVPSTKIVSSLHA